MVCRLIDFALVVLTLLMFKVCGKPKLTTKSEYFLIFTDTLSRAFLIAGT